MVLVDTSAWLFALRKSFHPVIKDRVEQLLAENDVAITGIIQVELLSGAKTTAEFDKLKSRLESLYTLESDKSLWDRAAKLAFDLRRKGVTVHHTDVGLMAM